MKEYKDEINKEESRSEPCTLQVFIYYFMVKSLGSKTTNETKNLHKCPQLDSQCKIIQMLPSTNK